MSEDIDMSWPEPTTPEREKERWKRKAEERSDRRKMEARRRLLLSVADPVVKQMLKHTCGKDGDPGAVVPLDGNCVACQLQSSGLWVISVDARDSSANKP